MSNLAHANGDDFPDAAGKHLDDATTLVNAGRHDGGAYLAGYVVECSLKTALVLEEIARASGLGPTALVPAMKAGGTTIASGVADGWKKAKKLGHDLAKLTAEATRLAALPSAVTAAYSFPSGPSAMHAPASPSWSESLRYREPGHIHESTARAWLAEATSVYATTVARMRRDGVIY